jgi:hypothetical protein
LRRLKDGVRTVVREIERLAVVRGLPPEDVPDLIEDAIDRYEPSSRRRSDIQHAARQAAEASVQHGASYVERRERQLADAFASWLKADGWNVELDVLLLEREFDVVARRDSETFVADVKAHARPIDIALVNHVVARLEMPRAANAANRRALVLADSGATQRAIAFAVDQGLELYVFDSSGSVNRLGQSPPEHE